MASGVISQLDFEGNSCADTLAADAALDSLRACGQGNLLKLSRSDISLVSARQLHNVVVVQKRWDFIKTRGLSVPDPPDDSPDDTSLQLSDEVVTTVSVGVDAPRTHADPCWPTLEQVSQCRKATPWFLWSAMTNCLPHRIEGTVLSRSASNYAWHYTQANFDDIRAYFHGLEWFVEGKVSFLELFVDFFAFTGCHLSNPKAGRTRDLETAANFSASFAAAIRAFPKVFQEKTPAHPAVACLVSHLTSFGMLKQVIGLSMRPRFQCPHVVHRFLCWSWSQPMKRTSWKWILPIEHLRQ